ncbi:MAG: Rab family GTPase [Candidatus Hodarchaeales archaeon]
MEELKLDLFDIRDDLYKICMVGDGGVGKTAVTERFLGKGFSSNYKLTIGVDILTHTTDIDDTSIKYQIWDLAGQQRFEFVRSTFYKGAHGIIMVFDLTRPDTLLNLREWKIEILSNIGKNSIPVVLLGNKSDLENKQLIDVETISHFREELKMEFQYDTVPFLYTSALSGMNVLEAFEALGYLLLKRKPLIASDLPGLHNKISSKNLQ